MREFDVFKDEENGSYQLRTKTTLFSISFDDLEQEAIFNKVVHILRENEDITIKGLVKELLLIEDDGKVMDVLYMLNENFLLPLKISNELNKNVQSRNDHFEIPVIDNTVVSIFGHEIINNRLEEGLLSMGIKNVVSFPFDEDVIERVIDEKISESDLVIVNANEWSPYHIELINKSALTFNKPWLYIGGFEESIIKIGPLFYGTETGCYDCLISRIKSNLEYPEYLVSYETFLRSKKASSKPDLSPIQANIVANIISDLALIEVHKFLYKWAIPSTWRTVINFDISNFKMTNHTLLKKPYCTSCKPELKYNKAPWLEAITLK